MTYTQAAILAGLCMILIVWSTRTPRTTATDRQAQGPTDIPALDDWQTGTEVAQAAVADTGILRALGQRPVLLRRVLLELLEGQRR